MFGKAMAGASTGATIRFCRGDLGAGGPMRGFHGDGSLGLRLWSSSGSATGRLAPAAICSKGKLATRGGESIGAGEAGLGGESIGAGEAGLGAKAIGNVAAAGAGSSHDEEDEAPAFEALPASSQACIVDSQSDCLTQS